MDVEVRMDSQLSSKNNSKAVSRFSNRRIHFIGIGGCGMSGLARMLLDAGAIVSGSDVKLNAQINELAARGASISIEQNGKMLRCRSIWWCARLRCTNRTWNTRWPARWDCGR